MTTSLALSRFHRMFDRYEAEIIRLIRRLGSVIESENAGSINGKTAMDLLASGRQLLLEHETSNNPHLETAITIGSLPRSEILQRLSSKLSNGVVPISLYGIADEMTDAEVDAVWTHAGSVITCTQAMTAVMSGNIYIVPAQSIDLAPLSESVATIYLYLKLRQGKIRYLASKVELPESPSTMLIGSIVYNGSVVVMKKVAGVIRLRTYRLSHLPIGSAVPVTEGPYANPIRLSESWIPLPPVTPVFYRFFKIVISETGSQHYETSIAELELASDPGGVDITSPTMVTDQSSFIPYPATPFSLAIDNDDDAGMESHFMPNAGLPAWGSVDLGEVMKVSEIRLLCQNNDLGPTRAPTRFTLQGSDDGSTWVDVKEFSNISGWQVGVWKSFVLRG